jgi:hypothetical protein
VTLVGRAGVWGLVATVSVTGLTERAAAQIQTVANLIIDDGAMVVKAAPGKRVYVGAASSTRTVTLAFDAGAVDEFVAEAQALAARGAQRLAPRTIDRPVLEEQATARALSMTRQVPHGGSRDPTHLTYHFFVSDDRLGGFTLVATATETKAILLALHRAARAANVLSGSPAPGRGIPKKPVSSSSAPHPAPTSSPPSSPPRGPS